MDLYIFLYNNKKNSEATARELCKIALHVNVIEALLRSAISISHLHKSSSSSAALKPMEGSGLPHHLLPLIPICCFLSPGLDPDLSQIHLHIV